MPLPESDHAHILAVLIESGVAHTEHDYESGPTVYADGPKPGKFDLCSSQPGVRFDFDPDGKLLDIAIYH